MKKLNQKSHQPVNLIILKKLIIEYYVKIIFLHPFLAFSPQFCTKYCYKIHYYNIY